MSSESAAFLPASSVDLLPQKHEHLSGDLYLGGIPAPYFHNVDPAVYAWGEQPILLSNTPPSLLSMQSIPPHTSPSPSTTFYDGQFQPSDVSAFMMDMDAQSLWMPQTSGTDDMGLNTSDPSMEEAWASFLQNSDLLGSPPQAS